MIIALYKNTEHILSRDEQLDEYLSKGCSLYDEDAAGKRTLIADPDQGFLVEKPTLEESHTVNLTADSEALKALRIILYGEE